MKTVLVTGATGCIGSNLIVKLLEEGYDVRGFHRSNSNPLALRDVALKRTIGDVRDKTSLRAAIKGCDIIFHTAAIVSFWRPMREEQLDVNVNGTRNVVDLCVELGVQKLVHTSSVAALGYRTDGGLIDEQTPFNWDERITYKYSKRLAELEILRGVERGLNASIVNPTVVIGPRDPYVHGGQIVRDISRQRVPAYVKGGMNIVSVHDVVTGHLAAALRGRPGERYILGGVNLTHRDVFALVAKVLHARTPRIKAPVWAVRAIARACDVIGTMSHKQPWITSELISGVGMNNWYSIEKANRELGYEPTSIEQAIREAFEWYAEHNMI